MSSKSVLAEYQDAAYNRVRLTLEFKDKLLAGIPQSGDMLDYFIKMKQMSDAEKDDLILRIQKGAMTDEEKTDMKETSWTVFEKDRDGFCVLWANNVKALMREIFSTTGMFMEKRASSTKGAERASGKQTYQHLMHVEGLHVGSSAQENPLLGNDVMRIRILANGLYRPAPQKGQEPRWEAFPGNKWQPMKQAHGYVDRVKHISDASGKRSAIGRHDFFEKARLVFDIKWLNNGVYSMDDMRRSWALAQDDGLGASRSQGFGKFDVVDWQVLAYKEPKTAKAEAVPETTAPVKTKPKETVKT